MRSENLPDSSWREAKLRWLPRVAPQLQWAWDELDAQVAAMNAAWHRIDYDPRGWHDAQFTEYHAPGGFYREHQDTFFEGRPVQRKVSCTVQLNDPAEYEGGLLQVMGCPVRLQHGDIAVFPSVCNHSVSTVTKGTRISLVCWYDGPPWR